MSKVRQAMATDTRQKKTNSSFDFNVRITLDSLGSKSRSTSLAGHKALCKLTPAPDLT
jgi:hypothetical protein